MEDWRFVSFIGSNGLDKWLKSHRKFVRIQFHRRKRNENYIYIFIWNFKNLQFDGIVSKCSLVPSSGIIRQLMIIGES